MEPFDSTWGDQLYKTARVFLSCVRDGTALARGMARFHGVAEEMADSAGVETTACRAGCPHCCVLNVSVLLPEAAAIALHVLESTPLDGRERLIARLDYQRLRVRWMEDGERVRRQIECLFLDGAGSCTIHPFRPLMCRGVTSLDAALCREALDPTELDVPRAVPADMVRRHVMDDAFCALARAMEEQGMDARSIELAAGVVAFMSRPELTGLLLAGKRMPGGLWE